MPKTACYSFPLETSFSNSMAQTDIKQGTASCCDISPKRKYQRKTVSSPRTRSIKKVNRKEKEVTTQYVLVTEISEKEDRPGSFIQVSSPFLFIFCLVILHSVMFSVNQNSAMFSAIVNQSRGWILSSLRLFMLGRSRMLLSKCCTKKSVNLYSGKQHSTGVPIFLAGSHFSNSNSQQLLSQDKGSRNYFKSLQRYTRCTNIIFYENLSET